MSINSKQKGARGERELARKLRDLGYDCRRSQQYSGLGDSSADVIGLPGIHIEVKRTERLSLYDAVAQAKRDASGSGDLPAVFHRRSNCEWVVVMELEDWIEIYREWECGQQTSHATRVREDDTQNNPVEVER